MGRRQSGKRGQDQRARGQETDGGCERWQEKEKARKVVRSGLVESDETFLVLFWKVTSRKEHFHMTLSVLFLCRRRRFLTNKNDSLAVRGREAGRGKLDIRPRMMGEV